MDFTMKSPSLPKFTLTPNSGDYKVWAIEDRSSAVETISETAKLSSCSNTSFKADFTRDPNKLTSDGCWITSIFNKFTRLTQLFTLATGLGTDDNLAFTGDHGRITLGNADFNGGLRSTTRALWAFPSHVIFFRGRSASFTPVWPASTSSQVRPV